MEKKGIKSNMYTPLIIKGISLHAKVYQHFGDVPIQWNFTKRQFCFTYNSNKFFSWQIQYALVMIECAAGALCLFTSIFSTAPTFTLLEATLLTIQGLAHLLRLIVDPMLLKYGSRCLTGCTLLANLKSATQFQRIPFWSKWKSV